MIRVSASADLMCQAVLRRIRGLSNPDDPVQNPSAPSKEDQRVSHLYPPQPHQKGGIRPQLVKLPALKMADKLVLYSAERSEAIMAD
jgi:hypothetical protein